MKNKFTKIKTLCFIALFGFAANKFHAATITATVSGNWSSSSTWSGGSPGNSITTDNVVIPAGINVTMDMDIQVSTLGSIAVSGSLTSTSSNSLTIGSLGSLTGNGYMNMQYLEISSGGTMSFSGAIMAHRFVNSALALNLSSQVVIADTLHLKAGSISIGSGGNITMNGSSNIKIDGGSMTLGSGGVFTNTNSYNLIYVGSSKTTGIEFGGASVNNVWINLSGSNQTVTMGSGTLTVNGAIHHNSGMLALNGTTLIMKGDYMSTSGAMISGSSASNLMIETSSALSSSLVFDNSSTAGHSLNNMEVNIASGGNANLASNLIIDGMLTLKKGHMQTMSNGTLTMAAGSTVMVDGGDITSNGGSFDGSAAYNVSYVGSSKMTGIELSGTGLNDVMVNMTNSSDSVYIAGNNTINGTLNLNNGSYAMHGHSLTIKGGLMSTMHGMLMGNSASDLMINTTGNLGDTLMFDQNHNHIHNFTINTGNGSNVMLGNSLMVENMTFTNGGVTIWDNDLSVNSTGSISGASSTKYVMIKGNGSLMMNVNSSSPYVMFPIGTSTSYGAAYIQRNSGSAGMIGVSTHNGIYMMGTYGTDNATTQSVVNRTWDVHSSSSVDLNLKFEWTSSMEVNSFNRNMAHISHYTNNAWDTYAATSATATGSSTYQISRNGITSLSPFSVVDNNATVGIEEQKADNMSVSIYPVPVENRLNFSVPNTENFNVEVFDAVGNKVKSKAFTQDASVRQLDMSDLNSGVYFVKISTDKAQTTKRIVKN